MDTFVAITDPRCMAGAGGYDAVSSGDKRRRLVRTITKGEDDVLKGTSRRKLIATTRDLSRNFPLAAWAIRRHMDYVSMFQFQSRSGDKSLDADIERLMIQWSHASQCAVAGRHSLLRLARLWEQRRVVDGDVLIVRLSSGQLQTIEGDRIKNPSDLPAEYDSTEFVNGVRVSKAGRARDYVVCKRVQGLGGMLKFERVVPARHAFLHGYFDRFDQVRGISPLAAAVNAFQDIYEATDYALAKMKVSQLFALAIYTVVQESFGDVSGGEDEDGNENADKSSYDVDFGKGPIKLELEPGDRAEFLESRSPSTEFRQFGEFAIMAALKALDIPYSFFAENFTNYSGARQALLQYQLSARVKQDENRQLRNWLTRWKLQQWILDGTLTLPRNVTFDDLRWDWIPAGTGWIDPLKEVNAFKGAVRMGFTSTARVCKSLGVDPYELADEEASYQEYRRGLGLPDTVTEVKRNALSERAQRAFAGAV